MATKFHRSHFGIGKIIIIVVGITVLCMGLISHFSSDWRFANKETKICEEYEQSVYARSGYKSCPPFAMEVYFVSAIIICFLLSVVSLFYFTLVEYPSNFIKTVDIGYHFVAALMLIIAGSLYIKSSIQVLNTQGINYHDGKKLEYKFGEKMIAGVLTIIQGIIYGSVALYVSRGSSENISVNDDQSKL